MHNYVPLAFWPTFKRYVYDTDSVKQLNLLFIISLPKQYVVRKQQHKCAQQSGSMKLLYKLHMHLY